MKNAKTKPGTSDQPITSIHVQVIQGQARLAETGEQTGTFLLNTDNSAEVQLISDVAEETVVRLPLPEASSNIHDFTLQFVTIPG